MVSIYTKSTQIFNAENFKASVGDASEPYVYFTFGKVEPWPSIINPPQEDPPSQANSSVATFNQVWKNMMGAKKIVGNDVRLAIRRFDWVSGTVYDEYDDSEANLDMNDPDVKFYVLTDEWNVYKCLGNNNGGVSTVKPTTINTYIAERVADKYIWKYMYTLSDEEKLRFTTENYIPVRTLTEDNGTLQWHVQNSAVQGSIGSIKIVDTGSGYLTTPTITITGDGTGAEAAATLNVTTSGIESILITNKGQNYTYANVAIISAIGSGANARAIMSPTGGHGADPVEELGGSFVMINPRLRGSESGIFDTQNEIRQIALIKNPVLRDGVTIASGIVYSQTTTVEVEPTGDNYIEDEYVFQGASLSAASFKGRVVSWNSAQNLLNLIDVSGTLTTDGLTGDTSKASRLVLDSIDKAFTPYTGTLLYINNIAPIQRATDQTEDFKIVVSF
jgi:hypothetical protein